MQTAPYHAQPIGKVAATHWHDNSAYLVGQRIMPANRQAGIGHCPNCLALNCLIGKRYAPPARHGVRLVRHYCR